jgi:hypothetical protein
VSFLKRKDHFPSLQNKDKRKFPSGDYHALCQTALYNAFRSAAFGVKEEGCREYRAVAISERVREEGKIERYQRRVSSENTLPNSSPDLHKWSHST